ncbi:DMT family transporter [Sulfitobacter sp. R18_1]|uniref:DMT family transporter n=1 Tax=Sulfitobacter sp. R18_1 TaxID=2821104 RepID=UPI001ADD03E7|nr:DMT family transporter [Sulfitobacter sp. R18_1]MBO9428902.1 DMT family transporter [Sulfitobacter sp. R18_1]
MTDQTKGLLLTFLGVMCIVPEALFVRVIDAPMLTLAFWKVTLVGMAIGAGLLLAQGTAPFRALSRAGWASAIYIGGVACAGVGFVLAVRLTSVANVVFILASLPVFAAIYSRVFLGEPISRRMFFTIAAVLAGLAVIAFGSSETENASRAGDLLALSISAIFAGALTAARHARAVSMVPAVALAYLLAGAVLLPVAQPLHMPTAELPQMLLYAAFMAASAGLIALGPRYISSAEVGLLVLLESVLAPLLVWAVLGEDPGIYALIGGGIVVGALFLSNLIALSRRRRVVPPLPRH